MRISILCAVLFCSLWTFPAVAEETKQTSPYDRVATGKRPAKEDVRVYTNLDLEKLHVITNPEDREVAEASDADKNARAQTAKPKPDPLAWLQQSQAAERKRRQDREDAQKALVAARARLANLEKQLLATRNPFAARPELSEEEKETRGDRRETAAERNERTRKMVEEARAAVRAAEAEVARPRSNRP